MMGIDAATGDLRWITKLDPDPHAIITGSPVLAERHDLRRHLAGWHVNVPGSARRSQRPDGRILWRTYSLPNPDGLPGGYWGAVMFAPPAVDLPDGLVFATFKVAAKANHRR